MDPAGSHHAGCFDRRPCTRCVTRHNRPARKRDSSRSMRAKVALIRRCTSNAVLGVIRHIPNTAKIPRSISRNDAVMSGADGVGMRSIHQ